MRYLVAYYAIQTRTVCTERGARSLAETSCSPATRWPIRDSTACSKPAAAVVVCTERGAGSLAEPSLSCALPLLAGLQEIQRPSRSQQQ